jgi:hypothetical protein
LQVVQRIKDLGIGGEAVLHLRLLNSLDEEGCTPQEGMVFRSNIFTGGFDWLETLVD